MQPCNQSSLSTTAPSVDPPPTNLQERLYTRAEFLNLKILLGQAGVVRSFACVITYPSGCTRGAMFLYFFGGGSVVCHPIFCFTSMTEVCTRAPLIYYKIWTQNGTQSLHFLPSLCLQSFHWNNVTHIVLQI